MGDYDNRTPRSAVMGVTFEEEVEEEEAVLPR